MVTKNKNHIIFESMLELLELPDSAYEKARERYENLGEWFGRDESTLKGNDPHIFPQGSFRLGTAIRPLDEKEEYDLDLACELRANISKDTHTQEALKTMVGHEIEIYRIARGIKAPKEEKHRCWRLEYQDDLSFHMDIVPCIPAEKTRQFLIMESIRKAGESESIAGTVSQLTVSITDDRHHGYKKICDDWNISNPEGYAKWFETRMNQTQHGIFEKAQLDDLPLFKRRTPLQRTIQLLKRHRDHMFRKDKELKPISIILTTLVARAYHGESDIGSALNNILLRMEDLVSPIKPRVPNPVNPAEDFADRWEMPKYKHLNLEANFWNWLTQAKSDFDHLVSTDDVNFIMEQARQKFSLRLSPSDLGRQLDLIIPSIALVTPKSHKISNPARPWGFSR
jgi:hypothetical protein